MPIAPGAAGRGLDDVEVARGVGGVRLGGLQCADEDVEGEGADIGPAPVQGGLAGARPLGDAGHRGAAQSVLGMPAGAGKTGIAHNPMIKKKSTMEHPAGGGAGACG